MTDLGAPPPRWQGWILYSSSARAISWAVGAATALAGTTALSVAIVAFVRERPTRGVSTLLLVGIPVLVAGQVWGVAWTQLRRREGRRTRTTGAVCRGKSLTNLYGPLDRRLVWVLVGLSLVCFLLAMTAARSAMNLGGPTSPTPGCPYRLLNHGSYTCVSHMLYEHVSAAVQRFAAAILAMFFIAQSGLAFGGLKTQDAGGFR